MENVYKEPSVSPPSMSHLERIKQDQEQTQEQRPELPQRRPFSPPSPLLPRSLPLSPLPPLPQLPVQLLNKDPVHVNLPLYNTVLSRSKNNISSSPSPSPSPSPPIVAFNASPSLPLLLPPPPMSYHRVLPPPPALANCPTANSWGTEQDSLLQHKIMTDDNPSTLPTRTKSVTTSQKTSSSTLPLEKAPLSPGVESSEDSDNSPKERTNSSSQNSNGGNVGLGICFPSISWQGESPSQICLCQPDPKIPRPRNAFILYRQHHQSRVVAQNPGLANPEISKVIGDHWRTAAPEIKDHWKLLAEEEKLRHQKQYPDYRYQPRRSGRNNSQTNSTSSPNDGEDRRCAKCGGRSMTTPGMMSAAFSSVSNNTPSAPYSPSRPISTPSTGSGSRRFPHGFDASHLNESPGGVRHRPNTSSNNLSALQLASPRLKRHPDATEFPLSPDTKRRRIANSPYNAIRAQHGQLTPFPFPQARRRESLPRPDFMPSQGNSSVFTMAPPPRPNHVHPDSSLKLPPLQTPAKLDSPSLTQAKSVEAMVMSIPTLNKIRILAKISPPLPQPGPTSPPHAFRGFVIAVDGLDTACVGQITKALSTSLSEHHPVRVFEIPSNRFPVESACTFQSYLNIVQQYHTISAEMISYITTNPTQPASPLASESPVSPKTTPSKPTTRSSSQKKPDTPSSNLPPGVPIALVPSFQLSHADAFASRIPIADAYAPIDHWQWTATIWRGIVGPDVTIAVVPPPPPTMNPLTTPPSNAETPKPSSMLTKAKSAGIGSGSPGYEVRLEDAKAILVRVDGKEVSDVILRRVGFEVGEWVRGRDDGRRAS